MELQLDGGIHHGMIQGMCAHSNNLPTLQHASFGNYSENMFSEQDVKTAQSENEDTDYDLNEEDEESEEDEDDENSEDDSQVHALIDDLELKFRMLVSNKIVEAEQFFDDATTFQRPISNPTLMETENKWNSSPLLLHGEEAQEDLTVEARLDVSKHVVPNTSTSVMTICNDVSTQTVEDTTCCSHTIASSTASVSGHSLTKVNVDNADPEKARHEICQLRDVRESLIAQRRTWADQMKQIDEKNDDELKNVEGKVYELEEAIEAVDTAIEFKNEVVIGQPQSKLASKIPPGSNEAQLVTRLEFLSLEELQRLLCLYFAKVVELRTTSRRLEKHLEHAENCNDQLNLRLAQEHKYLKDMNKEHQSRIRLILSCPSNSAYDLYVRRMDESLAAARKKQHDLERSLTELLVRHGYLVNGADYDVKQVVKMLGIESQLAVTTQRNLDGTAGDVGSVQPHHSRGWETGGGWSKGSKNRHAGLGHRRNGRQIDGQELQHIHREGRMADGWEREREREHRQMVPPSQPPEVRREKRRLIIQPAVPSSVPTHHGSPNNHSYHYSHPHSHQPSYGSNPHGYK